MIKLALVEDQIMFRQALKKCLEDDNEFKVVCEAKCGAEFEKMYKPDEIDVILLDMRLKGQHGLTTCQNLCNQFPDIKIIILTAYAEADLMVDVMRKGARAYISKAEDIDKVKKVIRYVIENEYYFDQDLGKVLNNAMNKTYKSQLIDNSFRVEFDEEEIQVVMHACSQLTIEETYEKMATTKRVVENIRNRLVEKTDSKNFTGVIIYMFKHLILYPDQFSENDYFRK